MGTTYLLSNGRIFEILIMFHILGNCDFNAVSELRSLKARLEELESDLRDRDEEIRTLKEQTNQLKSVNGDDSDAVKVNYNYYLNTFFN